MIILGLILAAAGVAAVVGVLASSTDVVSVQAFGYTTDGHQVGVVFAVGALAGLAFAIGVAMLTSGLGRGIRRRRETRRAEKMRRAEEKTLRQRNFELEKELASERAGSLAAMETSTGIMPADADGHSDRAIDLTDQPTYADRGTR